MRNYLYYMQTKCSIDSTVRKIGRIGLIRYSSSFTHVNIFKALINLDGLNKMHIFVARDINRLPDQQPEELNLLFIVECLSNLEKKNKEDKISKPTIEATNVISDSVVQKVEVEEDSHDNKSVSDMS